MRVLLLRLGFVHEKNLTGFRRMCSHVDAELVVTDTIDLATRLFPWNLVWIPFGVINPSAFPNAKRIILGPHNFVFPKEPWTSMKISDTRTSYNCLSDWNRDVYNKFGGVSGLDLVCYPYPVDTDRFLPSHISKKNQHCFLYTKLRKTEDVKYAIKCLESLGLSYTLIQYGSYNEVDYIRALETCAFGVWVGRHESQGFALQEALSADVPLVVWDITCMGEEWEKNASYPVYRGHEGEMQATAVPYWDTTCGIRVNQENLKEAIHFMRNNWPMYRPRKFVLDNLSVQACAKKWGLKN